MEPSLYVTAVTGLGYAWGAASVPSVLLRRRGQPAAALSWIFALLALPGLGAILWWFFGRTRLERRARRRTNSLDAVSRLSGARVFERGTEFDAWIPKAALGESIFPSRDNKIEPLVDGEAFYSALEAEIAAAKYSIAMLVYIWQPDEVGVRIRDLLAERAKAGVTVRVLVDAHGSPSFRGAFLKRLQQAGAEVRRFAPRFFPGWGRTLNFVNHRKIFVFDGRVAFTGGMNIGCEYRYEWRDLMLRIEGRAVLALARALEEDWYFMGAADPLPTSDPGKPGSVACAVVATGPTDDQLWMHQAFFQAITHAKRRLWIATPYFIPTPALSMALRVAAGTGVDVRVVIPVNSDVRLVRWASRSFYPELIKSGVRVFEYRGPMLHAKMMLGDELMSTVGSANLDTRSLRLSFEVSCFSRSREINQTLSDWYGSLIEDADEITAKTLGAQARWRTLIESAAHLGSPLL